MSHDVNKKMSKDVNFYVECLCGMCTWNVVKFYVEHLRGKK